MTNKNIEINCCLWNGSILNKSILLKILQEVKILTQDSHFTRKIMKCSKCGQLYLYQFEEEVDWMEGKDEQYYKWIPVASSEEAEELSNKTTINQLNGFPCIRIDFTKEMNSASKPYIFIPFEPD